MSHTPDFIYGLIAALEANQAEEARNPPPNRATTANVPANPPNRRMPPNPLHGCIRGMKVDTCPGCAGHAPRGNRFCQRCGNKGFVMSKCGACIRMGHDALVRLVVEKRAEWRAAARAEAEAEAAAAAAAQAEAQAVEGAAMEMEVQDEEKEDLMEGVIKEPEKEVDEAMGEVMEVKDEEEEVGEKKTR